MRTKEAKTIKPNVVEAIKGIKTINPEYSANQILSDLTRNRKIYHLNGDPLPKLRSIQNILKNNKVEIDKRIKEHIPNDLDLPWNMGRSINESIPNNMLPIVIRLQQIIQTSKYRITIRQARWFSRLYPAVKILTENKWSIIITAIRDFIGYLPGLLIKENQNQTFLRELAEVITAINKIDTKTINQDDLEDLAIIMTGIIMVLYSREEQVSELLNWKFDTSELDFILFIQQDITPAVLFDSFIGAFAPISQQKGRAILRANSLQENDIEDLEQKLGKKMTKQQIDAINGWIRAWNTSFTSVKIWTQQHPSEYSQVQGILEAISK